jgi:murein DD-endopeptidase MepM/ murein hydrolase activator NlpD
MKIIIALTIACLPLNSLNITSPFGYRIHPLTGKVEYHNGVDLKANSDTVYAVLHGVVWSIGYDPSLGISIDLQHGEITTIYGHLFKPLVSVRDTVFAGQPIAISGATGYVTRAHLHFSVRFKKQYINPLNFLYEILNTTKYEQKF